MMNDKIFYATSSNPKFEEIKGLISEKVMVEKINLPYPEIQAEDTDKVVIFGADHLANKENKNIIIDDMGLFIDFVNDFPGPYVKKAAKMLGPEKILMLMESADNRNAFFKVSLGFCRPGESPNVFSAIRKGTISKKIISGPYNLGLNSIFIPEGQDKTLAQFSFEEKLINEPRREAFLKFLSFLKKEVLK